MATKYEKATKALERLGYEPIHREGDVLLAWDSQCEDVAKIIKINFVLEHEEKPADPALARRILHKNADMLLEIPGECSVGVDIANFKMLSDNRTLLQIYRNAHRSEE